MHFLWTSPRQKLRTETIFWGNKIHMYCLSSLSLFWSDYNIFTYSRLYLDTVNCWYSVVGWTESNLSTKTLTLSWVSTSNLTHLVERNFLTGLELNSSCFISTSFQELSASQQEELRQRAAYLRQQRDKLQALKKEQQKTKLSPALEEAPIPTSTSTTITPVSTTPRFFFVHYKVRSQQQASNWWWAWLWRKYLIYWKHILNLTIHSFPHIRSSETSIEWLL